MARTVTEKRRAVKTALMAGLPLSDALAHAEVEEEEWGRWWKVRSFQREIKKIEADIAVLAGASVRRAVKSDPAAAERYRQDRAARQDIERLRDISGACR